MAQGSPQPGWRHGIAARLARAMSVVVALFVLCSGLWLVWVAHEANAKSVMGIQHECASRIAHIISAFISSSINQLVMFAAVTRLDTLELASQQQALSDLLLNDQQLFSQLMLLDTHGREVVRFSRTHTYLPGELQDRQDSEAYFAAAHGSAYISPVYISPDSGLLAVQLAIPLKSDEGVLRNVLCAEVNVTRMWSEVAQVEIGRTGYAYLVDSGGGFIAYQEPSEVLNRYGEDLRHLPAVSRFADPSAGAPGVESNYTGLTGALVRGMHVPIEHTDWAVVVEWPVQDAFASEQRMLRILGLLLALSLLATGGAVLLVVGRIIRPVSILTRSVQRMGEGVLSAQVEGAGRRDEVGLLARGFIELQDELRRVYQGLEQRQLELHAAEEALKLSEQRYRELFLSVPIGLFRTTPDGKVLEANPALVHMLGYPDAESFSRVSTQQLYVNPADRQAWQELLKRDGVVREFEVQLRKADGTVAWVRENALAYRDPSNQLLYYEGSVEDITERKRAEEALLHAHKMESIGRLAGGVAHDFNNLLTPILGYTDLLLGELAPDNQLRQPLQDIHQAALRARDLTRQLLAFSRRQVLELKLIDLGDVVKGFERMLRRTIREDIGIEFSIAAGPNTVLADASQIEQVLLNLAINAQDAMPGGGLLRIEVGSRHISAEQQEQDGAARGTYVLLCVSDNGSGMDPATLEHIFEPFFTTKERSKGTGLGLATVYGIVRQHNGFLQVDSDLGRGSRFSVHLPLVQGSGAAEQAPFTLRPELAAGGGESGTVLVVEDNRQVMELACTMLRSLGYEVLSAADFLECRQVLNAHGKPVDLLLSDVIMPGMNGRELYTRLHNDYPQLRVLYMSGYASQVVADRGVLDDGVALLHKPFTVQALAQKVREVLTS